MEREEPLSVPEDARPFWLRLFRGTRPFVEVEKIKRTGEMAGTVGIQTKVEF